jgi:hypothetical protein
MNKASAIGPGCIGFGRIADCAMAAKLAAKKRKPDAHATAYRLSRCRFWKFSRLINRHAARLDRPGPFFDFAGQEVLEVGSRGSVGRYQVGADRLHSST